MNEEAYDTFFSFTIRNSWYATFIKSSFKINIFLIKPLWLAHKFLGPGDSISSNMQGKLGSWEENRQKKILWLKRGE